MKKFLVLLSLLVMMSKVVYGVSFEDISGLSCEKAVEKIAHLGIVNGVSENKYAPEKIVTRAELSKMIVSSVMKSNIDNTISFSDIQNHWGKDFILSAANAGILNGYEDGTFKPDREVTYAEAITIMVRALGYTNLEVNSTGLWYENYITKMKELHLNNGLKEFSPDSFANRGDIAILLWNMIKDSSNGDSMLKEKFSNYTYWENVEVKDITAYAGRIVYDTSKGAFYKDSDVDFSDLGSLVSGFYDAKNNVLHCMTIDEGENLKKISGNVQTISDMGYETFNCKKISGYGQKEHAKYVEIFVDNKTNETVRVVFYDTRESYFVEKVKIGKSKISIESKDVYDHSIVLLDNGQTIKYNILRTESVKDIDINAILVFGGKVVSWDSIPNNSVIREIKKNQVYTYVNEYIDGKLDEYRTSIAKLKIGGKEYIVSDDCICENVVTNTTMKLAEGLTTKKLKNIAANDDKIRVYLNEFGEVVKFQFSYDVWKIEEHEERKEEIKDLEAQLKNIGLVSKMYNYLDQNKEFSTNIAIATNHKDSFNFKNKDNTFKVGDFVYLDVSEDKNGKKEEKLIKISSTTKFDGMDVLLNYNFPIEEDRINNYKIDELSQIYKITLQRDSKNENEFEKCKITSVAVSELEEYTNYKSIHLLVNEEGVVIRLYAIKVIGNTYNVGIVNDIKETNKDDSNITKVYIMDEDNNITKYTASPYEIGYKSGDIVVYNIDKSNKGGIQNEFIVNEIYRHEFIGNVRDLIVKNAYSTKIIFENSDIVFDLESDSFECNGEKYYLEDYVFINATVGKNKKNNEWIFSKFSIKNKDNVKIARGNRVAIDELSGIIVVYSGYKE